MERNENDIFDELVRGKLANYTEAPEPEWIRSIQAKKSRAVSLYQLYRLMLIAVIVGAGLFAGIQLMPYQFSQTTNATQNLDKQHDAVQPSPLYSNTKQNAEFASANGGTTAPSSSTPAPAVSNNVLLNTDKVIPAPSAKPSLFNKSETNTPNDVKPTLENSKNQETNIKNTPASEETIKQPEADKKDKTQANAAPCKATFDYYTSYSGEFSFVHLAELNKDATLSWDFGDGATSEQESASHAYKHSGTYEVTLTVTDKENTCSFSNSITYRNPSEKTTPITISGKVVAGSSILKDAPVELFKFDEQKGRFRSVRTQRTNHMGEYTITLERNTRYIIKGYPTNEAQYYAATYWGNSTESENAGEILVMPSESEELFGYTIQLTKNDEPVEAPLPLANATPEFQQVYLVNANNQIVSIGTVDSKGNYTFGDGVPSGDYKIVNPSNGASTSTTIPATGGSLSGTSPELGGPASPEASKVTVFPNPANSVINFNLHSDQNEMATLVIMDASGVERAREPIVFNPGLNKEQYDISGFAPGVYYLMIFRNNKQVSSSRIVKLGNTAKE